MSLIEARLDRPVAGVQIAAWQDGTCVVREDALAVEEPLEIRLAGCSVAVTMRTPGHDLELAAGFLFTEGIIRGRGDIASLALCPADDPGLPEGLQTPPRGYPHSNVVNVNPNDPSLVEPERWRRNFFATSSCGICGKASIDAVRQDALPILSDLRVSATALCGLDARLREAQDVFARTGGLHAAGLFDAEGRLLTLYEDVGRHNAVDKVVGDAVLREAVPLSRHILMVSGRASFEIVQKALMAGIPVVASVSAPSSLAVELARDTGMTLIGFLRPGRFNVYTGGERIEPLTPPRI